MKKTIAAVAVSAAAIVAATMAFAGCGAKTNVAGTYTKSFTSGEYYALDDVKDYITTHPMEGQLAALWTEEMFWGALTSGILTEDGSAFLTSGGVNGYYTATLTLNENNTYTFTKEIKVDTISTEGNGLAALGFTAESSTPSIKVVFAGSYTAEDTVVTLAAPESISGSVVTVGVDSMAGYFPFSGNYTEIAVEAEDADNLLYPARFFYYFEGLYFTESDTFNAMTVTVDTEAKTLGIN